MRRGPLPDGRSVSRAGIGISALLFRIVRTDPISTAVVVVDHHVEPSKRLRIASPISMVHEGPPPLLTIGVDHLVVRTDERGRQGRLDDEVWSSVQVNPRAMWKAASLHRRIKAVGFFLRYRSCVLTDYGRDRRVIVRIHSSIVPGLRCTTREMEQTRPSNRPLLMIDKA